MIQNIKSTLEGENPGVIVVHDSRLKWGNYTSLKRICTKLCVVKSGVVIGENEVLFFNVV